MEGQIPDQSVDLTTQVLGQDIESLLDIFTKEQVKVGVAGNFEIDNGEAMLVETEGITLYGTTSEVGEMVNTSQGQVVLNLGASGNVRSGRGSSQDPTNKSRIVTHLSESSSLTGDNMDGSHGVESPLPYVKKGGGGQNQFPALQHADVLTVSSQVVDDLFNTPNWIKVLYPELHSVWLQNSGSQFYQGGVVMLCSSCRSRAAAGFHEGLPMCEACRVGVACTVCRTRVTSCFRYGLALCEADRIFLYRTLKEQTNFNKCQALCPVTVQKGCGKGRLKTCLSVKGFRFSAYISSSTGHLSSDKPLPKLRKYSGIGTYKELNFLPESINQDTIYPHPHARTATSYQQYQSNQTDIVQAYTITPGVQVQSSDQFSENVGDSQSQSFPQDSYHYSYMAPAQQTINQPRVYDGSGLGLSNRKERRSFDRSNDPRQNAWVKQQQEKYLQYHLALYWKRIKSRGL